jgi:hypothetical protein
MSADLRGLSWWVLRQPEAPAAVRQAALGCIADLDRGEAQAAPLMAPDPAPALLIRDCPKCRELGTRWQTAA